MAHKIDNKISVFVEQCSAIIASDAAMNFTYGTEAEFEDFEIQSPIEQLLYSAMKVVRLVNQFQADDPVEVHNEHYIYGIGFYPQRRIERYRVDFLVVNYEFPKKTEAGVIQTLKQVVVECDSQQWHERTEKERRYEKARDRALLAKGYTSLHYTGNEIIKDPFKIAAEVISHVTTFSQASLYEAVKDIEVNL